MGLIGGGIGGVIGGGLGEAVGHSFGGKVGGKIGGGVGKILGSAAGALLPFKKGGKVKKTGPALLHKGELVVPAKHVAKVPKSVKQAMKRDGARNM